MAIILHTGYMVYIDVKNNHGEERSTSARHRQTFVSTTCVPLLSSSFVIKMRLTAALVSALLGMVAAHPGEEHHHEEDHLLLARREHHINAARGLSACQSKRSFRELQARAHTRRAETVNLHRRNIEALKAKREIDASGTGHNLTDSRADIGSAGSSADEATVFGDSHTCILNPEGETGPYYVKGELIRSALREDQPGVPIVLDGQFIDVETCEPIQGLFWDIWNCNATGVYSGLVANGNGNTNDASNLDATFLRGIQETDADGVVQFLSVFPGHYSGRTTHHHMVKAPIILSLRMPLTSGKVAWLNAEILPNNTLTSGTAAHIGQVFWDQDLIDAVEATYPYNTNTVALTKNAEDRVVADETSGSSDPFFNYVYLGSDLSDGIFGWITIGINTSAAYSPNYSFEYTKEGGVALAETVGSDNVDGGAPGGAMNGTAPTFGNGTAAASGAAAGTGSTTSTGATSSSTVVVVSKASRGYEYVPPSPICKVRY
ncbi:extracellular dioxygenase [Diplogelasinospora grovesii]|uniref:Extracellular dioxygenase n=1 Tax=Diplogelasinospora grovesii TaxID=303347 RepID=A0AAN6N071_9PEZI|nr:extracellular dioxygenase [Diplogelasinospora grovesii]